MKAINNEHRRKTNFANNDAQSKVGETLRKNINTVCDCKLLSPKLLAKLKGFLISAQCSSYVTRTNKNSISNGY